MDINELNKLRNEISFMLDESFGVFEYRGCGANVGVWETKDTERLEKPIGDSYWLSKFRLWVFQPTQYGIQIKVEIFLNSVYEWETAFEGYIDGLIDITKILNFQLGLKRVKK